MKGTTILMSPHIKRALDLVAADKETTASELLRQCATGIVTEHNDGFFLRYALDVEQNTTEDNQ